MRMFAGLILSLLLARELTAAPHQQYHFVVGQHFIYHLHHRQNFSRMNGSGLSTRDITTDADVELHVDSVSEAGNTTLSIRIGNIKEDDIQRGHWTVSRIVLIPESRVTIASDGHFLRGSILKEDTARQESKKIAAAVAMSNVSPMKDRQALIQSLRQVVPILPPHDEFADNQSWRDSVIEGSENQQFETSSHVIGNDHEVVKRFVETITRSGNTLYSVASKPDYQNRAAWELTKLWSSNGKIDGNDLSEQSTEHDYFAKSDFQMLGHDFVLDRTKGPIKIRVTETLTLLHSD